MTNKLLLESFREAYRNLEMYPLLTQEDFDRFGVKYGTETLEELEQLIEDSPINSKIVFTGHRGCGKSTLLAKLDLKHQGDYFIVFFSIADIIGLSDVNHVNILFAIAISLMSQAEEIEVDIEESIKKSFYEWFSVKTKVKLETYKAEAGFGFSLLEIIKANFTTNSATRHEIREEFRKSIPDLINKINEIANAIKNEINQEILVIIDDLDKLDLADVKNIFRDNIKALFKPDFKIIFTIPMAALRDKDIIPIIEAETNYQVVKMSILNLFRKGEQKIPDSLPIRENIQIFKDILLQRIDKKLLSEEIIDEMAFHSGGILRQLIRIANECCRIGLRWIRRNSDLEDLAINEEILAEAINKMRNDFAISLSKRDYDILQKIYHDYTPDDPNEENFLQLLHGLHIIEYKDNTNLDWYEVHPVVIELLRIKNIVN